VTMKEEARGRERRSSTVYLALGQGRGAREGAILTHTAHIYTHTHIHKQHTYKHTHIHTQPKPWTQDPRQCLGDDAPSSMRLLSPTWTARKPSTAGTYLLDFASGSASSLFQGLFCQLFRPNTLRVSVFLQFLTGWSS
jgi:hypothetical protein